MKIRAFAFTSLAALAFILLCVPAQAADGHLARLAINGDAIDWQPLTQDGFTLTVSGPNGFYVQDTFRSGDVASLSGLEDGEYAYEITPIVEMRARTIVEDSDRGLAQVRAEAPSQSGHFRVVNGSIASGGQEEAAVAPAAPQGGLQNTSAADQVILDDLIVDGSACIGQDCVNGESFGFDTLRLKENNLRIKFQDTSASASFPTVDWQLTANDSSNGGANKFSIDNIDNGTTPFTVRSGAGSNALYIDDQGDIGIATSTPVVELHIVDGDSPTVRLEQNGSSGFGSQTWDIAGNETNFFVRDVTNGSKLPFKIFPNAPTNSLILEGTTGDLGIGIQSPEQPIHVVRSNDADFVMMLLEHNGASRIRLENNADNVTWNLGHANPGGQNFVISDTGDAVTELELDTSGNLVIAGGLTTAMNNLPDYVFQDDYQLMSLNELQDFIRTNRHLPNIPSAAEVEKSGQVNMTELQRLLLEKVEELTLYTLEQHNTIEELRARLAALETAGE